MGKFIDPFTDWGFKRIFGQETSKALLIGFLNDLLEGERHVTGLTFKDKEQLPETKDLRGIVYDIHCRTDTGERIIVEMQNHHQERFIDRSLYYAARSIVSQGDTRDWGYRLEPVYTVCFMNFLIKGDDTLAKFRTDVTLADMEDGRAFSDRMRLVYLTLPLFRKGADECETNLERWIYTLKNMTTLEDIPFLSDNPVFRYLADVADISALSQKDRQRYDESIKTMRDHISAYETAINKGRREGMAEGEKKGRLEGKAEGKIEGLKEGLSKGVKEEKIQTARRMKVEGFSIELITKITGLSPEEIASL